MREDEARQYLVQQVSVTRQLVTLAKVYLQKTIVKGRVETEPLFAAFTRDQGYTIPRQVVIHPSANPIQTLEQVARAYSCQLALCEALWSLVYQGVVVRTSDCREDHLRFNLDYTSTVPGSGGIAGGWSFPELQLLHPSVVMRAPSQSSQQTQPLSDGDLFISEARLIGAHPEVIEAVRDAVDCHRVELYRPAVAMLGKAMEGAWIEAGIALAHAILPADKAAEVVKRLQGDTPLAKKMREVAGLYDHQDQITERTRQQAQVRSTEMQQLLVWAEVLRDARNAIHFATPPTVANTYEKVGVLFLSSASNLAMLYRIKVAADTVAAQTTQPV